MLHILQFHTYVYHTVQNFNRENTDKFDKLQAIRQNFIQISSICLYARLIQLIYFPYNVSYDKLNLPKTFPHKILHHKDVYYY